jgi:NAD(P)H-quinone oxidoreductase subunit 5
MMQSIHQYAWIIPVFPTLTAGIFGFGLLFLRHTINSQRWIAACFNIAAIFTTMILSLGILYDQVNSNSAYTQLWSWMSVGGLSLQVGYLIDPLSSIMLVLVTSVALCVMIYTHGYMKHDQGYVRFFMYLSLFTASMLGLILSPNLLQIYIFWELVGVCSYLLVGFWFTRPSAAYACQKAFITNRIGDFGLLLGILGFYWLTGSLEFDVIAIRTQEILVENSIPKELLILFSIALFLGPVAKSAQFPLHIWLPDAMEGPTPISALIHAATMVAAGVFLVARLLPLFEQLPFMMDIIAYTGSITSLLGASIAIAQKDLKKGLAYSTMSQLGYMILALGVGSYGSGLFHLITHAYSKALLFLGSGSVIHGIEPVVGYHPNKCQNMTYMGGLRSYMPITASTFLLGTLSLCGVPPFACFWSKDEILADTWHKFPLLGFIAWLTAGLTAFYMFRIYFLTFEGEFRGNFSQELNSKKKYPHESSLSMTLPLVILAIPTILIGLIGAPFPNGIPNSSLLSHWLYIDNISINIPAEGWQDFIINALPSVGIGIAGASIAWLCYGPNVTRLKQENFSLDPSGQGLSKIILNAIYSWSLRRAYIDEIYDNTFIFLTRQLAKILAFFDQWAIDGIINSSGLITLLAGEGSRYTEGGRIANYILVLAIGLVALLTSSIIFNI